MINPATGRVHTHYSQAAVITGRLASSDPNLQNIPVRTEAGRRVREAFIAEQASCCRPTTRRSNCASWRTFRMTPTCSVPSRRGEDIHRATASEVFGVPLAEVGAEQRRAAKAINFGLIYGMGVFGLASNLGITRDAAQAYIDRYFTRYPGVARYMDDTAPAGARPGLRRDGIRPQAAAAGHPRRLGPRRQGAERAAINAPMQGTAADLIKMAMVAVQDWLDAERLRTRMIMQVHDELVLEVPDEELAAVAEAAAAADVRRGHAARAAGGRGGHGHELGTGALIGPGRRPRRPDTV